MATPGIWKLAGFDAPPLWFFEGAQFVSPSRVWRKQNKKRFIRLKGRKHTFLAILLVEIMPYLTPLHAHS
jgi:hypothetical protein